MITAIAHKIADLCLYLRLVAKQYTKLDGFNAEIAKDATILKPKDSTAKHQTEEVGVR